MDRAGVPGKPHSLRHWFGSSLKGTGVDSLVIKELMGHESLTTNGDLCEPSGAAENAMHGGEPATRRPAASATETDLPYRRTYR
jgi:integrase/recombinase XerD